MAALVHAVAAGSTNVASYLLARTRTLPLPTPGHSGSVPCPDAALAAVVRRFVAGPDLEAAGGWGSWGAEELQRALEDGLYRWVRGVGKGMGRHTGCAGCICPRSPLAERAALARRTAAALLEGGAHPSAAGQPSAFHAALRLSFPPEALPFLIHPGMVAATDTEGRTPLHALVAANHWGASVRAPLAAQLAAAGAPLAARDADGLTPLAAVCQRRREQQGQGGLPLILALSTADSVSAPSGDGRTPLQCTVAAGDVGAAAAMAAAGALDTATAQSMLALATSRASVAPEHVAALRVAGAELQGGTAIASRSAAVWHAFTAPLEVALARYGGTFKRSALLAALGRLSLPALAGELRQLATAATDAAGTARQHLQTVEAGYEAADDRYHAVYDNEVQLWMMRLNPPPIRLILKAANPEPGVSLLSTAALTVCGRA